MSDRPLDERLEQLLASPAVWAEPDPELEARVMSSIEGTPSTDRGSRFALLLGGIAAAVVVVVALLVVTGSPDPDWTVALAAPPESAIVGDVSGFNEDTGTRVVLKIDNLDPATDGTFYEVWWVDLDTGGAVSSGSFLESDTIEMWLGVRRSEFPKMLITLEPSDGDPSPSGDVIAWSDD